MDRLTLKTVSVRIDPDTVSEYVFARTKEYLLIDIEAPEVASNKVSAVARANCRVYERMVQKYSSSEYEFNVSQMSPPEPRTIKYLDTLRNAITGGSYLLTLTILEK